MSSFSIRSWSPKRRVLTGLVAVVLLVIGYRVIWRLTGSPQPPVDYLARVQEMAASHQPQGENGWPMLVEAANMVEAIGELEEIRGLVESRNARPSAMYAVDLDFSLVLEDETLDLARIQPEVLAIKMLREQGAFDLLDLAAAAPRFVRTIAPDPARRVMWEINLPELGMLRRLAQARAASMRLALNAGDQEEFLRGANQALAIVRASGGQHTLIDRLVAHAVASLILSEIRFALREHELDARIIRELGAAMDRQLRLPPFEMHLRCEQQGVLDAIQYCFTDDGHGDGRLDLNRFDSTVNSWAGSMGEGVPMATFGGHFLEGRADTITRVNDFYEALIANSRMTAPLRRDAMARGQVAGNPLDALAAPGQVFFDADSYAATIPARQPFLRVVLPAIGRVQQTVDRLDAEIAGTRLMLAIEQFRAERGLLPRTLDQLAGATLPRPVVDPISGLPFTYRLVRRQEGGETYVLYSLGTDATDDSAGADFAVPESVETLSVYDNQPGNDRLINAPRGMEDR